MQIQIPNLSFVVLIGPSGSGKSTFARKHFLPTEVISSDFCRGLVSDDENAQSATNDAFDVLNYIASKRLARGLLTVIDATNVQPESRRPLVELARKYHCLPVAIVFNLPEAICHERNRGRDDRQFGSHVIGQQRSQLRRSLKALKREGFRHVFVMEAVEEVEAAAIERVPLWNDRRQEHGPFDIIGDVHGCADELEDLLGWLGYLKTVINDNEPGWSKISYSHSDGRRAIFVGDLVDRGPRVLDTLSIVHNMVQLGSALCVPGNHDMKLLRKLNGKDVQITHGLAQSLAEIDALPDDQRQPFCKSLAEFLDGLVSHYVLDDGKLVVAHAGMKEEMQGRGSGKVRDFALYGETTGETDEFGLPVRMNWAAEYRGSAMVVYGHTPVPHPEWLNHTVNIDTGCVFGGKLTALRYPEREFVSISARQTYCEPARPFLPVEQETPALTAQQIHDDILDAEDVLGKRIISTRLHHTVTIREENATAALEVMSRFAANPKWLIYLPPTMSPCETSTKEGLLEHPAEAFAYFRSQGVSQVVCEQKHMGSRAVVVICRDQDAARERFGIAEGEAGIVYTRTGRRFFNDADLERQFLDRLRDALNGSGFWDEFTTTWACLDCELMPWSAKAQELLRSQYAAVGAAGNASLPAVVSALDRMVARTNGEDAEKARESLTKFRGLQSSVERFVAAYRQYCWSVASLDDLKLAPFHLLATEGQIHTHQNHVWHMETLAKICRHDPKLLLATDFKVIDVTLPTSEQEGTAWWEELTGRGGEGMVVKPLEFVASGKKGLVQPAVKCRGREYLRIIYGPDYTADEHLPRLRNRGLGGKRSIALREFALGIEALERFVRKEPLRRVHECVFGVLLSDASIEKSYTVSTQLDSYLNTQHVKTTIVDACITDEYTVSFAVDVNIEKYHDTVFDVSGVIEKSVNVSFSIDGDIEEANASIFVVDAAILKTKQVTSTLDSAIEVFYEITCDIDSAISKWHSEAFEIDAVILKYNDKVIVSDACLLDYYDVTTNIDAGLQETHTATTDVDGAILDVYSKENSVDSVVYKSSVKVSAVDVILNKTHDKSLNVEAVIVKTLPDIIGIDAILFKRYTKTVGIDSIIFKELAKEVSVDAQVIYKLTVSTAVDTVVRETYSPVFYVDVFAYKKGAEIIRGDACILKDYTKSVNLDGCTAFRLSTTTNIDSSIKVVSVKSCSVDASIIKAQTISFSNDVAILDAKDKTVLIDAMIQTGGSSSLGVSACIIDTYSVISSLDSCILDYYQKTISVDSRIGYAWRYNDWSETEWFVVLSYYFVDSNIDAVLSQTYEVEFSADAIIEQAATESITSIDAVILKTSQCEFAVDTAILLGNQHMIATLIDAVISTAPIIIYPRDGRVVSSPTYLWFRSTRRASYGSKHFKIYLDNVDDTFNSLELVASSEEGVTGWEYYDEGTWKSLPAYGLPYAKYGAEIRYLATLTLGQKYWKVKEIFWR